MLQGTVASESSLRSEFGSSIRLQDAAVVRHGEFA
jgi:hypothetical protein